MLTFHFEINIVKIISKKREICIHLNVLCLKRKVNPMPKKCTDFVVELRPQRLADVGRAVGEILHDPRRRGAVPTHLKWEMYQCNDRAICMNILWCAQAMLWLAVVQKRCVFILRSRPVTIF